MKAGFEMVNGSSLDHPMMIQTHEPWMMSSNRPCLNLNQRNELSDWVEQITKQLIDDDDDDDNNANGAFPASNQNKNNHHNDNDHNDHNIHHHISDHQGMNLMTLLFESAVAISVDNLCGAHQILLELSETASPYAPSCAERVVAYFARAMSTRVINSSLGVHSDNSSTSTFPYYNVIKNRHDYRNYQNTLLRNSLQAFNDVAPFLKFAHFTSNQAILEAFHGHAFVHVIDLDFLHVGLLHWPALLHGLATRPEGPPSHVRVTALGATDDLHSDAGKQLSTFAKRLGLSFEFTPLGSGIDISELRVRIGRSYREEHSEALAVHLLRHSLYDGNGSSDLNTMRLVEELRPRIFTLVEQDMAWHGGSFLDRFVGSLHYYSTVFDALGLSVWSDDVKRNMVESGVLHREISNVLRLGRRGDDHQERIIGGSWRREMAGRGCLAQVAMSGNAAAQAQLIVNMFGGGGGGGGGDGGGYRVVQGDGTIRLGWKETSLYTVSAWTSCTSSSYVNVSR